MEHANATYDSRVDIEPADLQTLELVRKKSSQSVPEIRAGEGVELATFSAQDRFGNSLGSEDIASIEVALKRNDTAEDVILVAWSGTPMGGSFVGCRRSVEDMCSS
jgi:hypothetical protein